MTKFHFYFLAGSIVSCIGLCLATLSPDVPTLIFTMGVIAGVGYGMINLPAKVNCQVPKGQEISKAIFESINFPKFDPKNLKDFCPMYFRAGILQIYRVKFWKLMISKIAFETYWPLLELHYFEIVQDIYWPRLNLFWANLCFLGTQR